jgi:hypothetical protein
VWRGQRNESPRPLISVLQLRKIYLIALVRFHWLGIRLPAGQRIFFKLHSVRTGSGAQSPSYPIGTNGSFSRAKAAGA